MYKNILTVILSFPALAWAGLSVGNLRCEFTSQPRGIESPSPRLGWQLQSDQRDLVQTAYQIEAASSPERLAAGDCDLWQSGRIASDQSQLIPYQGAALTSRQHVWWRVTVWDQAGHSARSDGPDFWEMGLLRKSDWTAQWIGGGDIATLDDPLVNQWCQDVVYAPISDGGYERERKLDERARNERPQRIATVKAAQPAVWLRQRFTVGKPVARARLYSAALGYYELYLDGHKISDRVLDPGQTDYEQRALYNIDDLTTALATGDHELRLLLAEGWYGQSQGFFDPKFRYGNPLALAQLEIVYQDGSQATVATDPTWECAASPLAKASIYSGEVYDGRLGEADLHWLPAAGPLHGQPLPEWLEAQLLPPIRKVRTVPALSVTQTRPGVWMFDLGQNLSGWVKLQVEAPRGTPIDLKFGELLTPGGAIDWDTQGRRAVGVYQHDRFIAGGNGVETYEPRFTYHGFRYVEVSGLTRPPTPADLTGYLVRTDVAAIGQFHCSDALMNRLHTANLWTYESNLVSIPTDCPTREKCGWLGDAHCSAEMSFYNYDMASFWSKYVRDIRTTSDLRGGLPDSISPGRRSALPSFDWALGTVLLPWRHYQYTGDTRLIEAHWPYMVRVLAHGREIAQGGIINDALGDWCDQPPTIALSMTRVDGSPFNSLPATTATMHYYYGLKVMARMARALGKTAEALTYENWSEETRTAINHAYFHARGHTYGSQAGNALAIMYGIPDEHQVAAVAAALAEEVEFGNAGHFNTGSHGSTYLYSALTDFGHARVARGIFAKTDYPSYNYMFSLGATTIWENMSRFDPVGKTTSKSLSHPFHTGYDHWFYGAVAGVRLDDAAPGYKKLLFLPQLVGSLTQAEGSIQTPYGLASSSWQITGGVFTWTILVPANTSATVVIPDLVSSLSEGDRPLATMAGAVKGTMYKQVLHLGSGRYTFAGNFN